MDIERIVWIVSLVASGAAGFAIGTYRGNAELESYKLDAAVLRADQGRQAYERLVAAQDALSASRADSDALRLDAERVRKSYESRLRKVSAAACGAEREAVARCEGLLRESAELLAEGGSLLQGNAAIHDATIEAIGGVK